jgi:adenylate cyclase
VDVHSHIKEIHNLAVSIATMKEALQNFGRYVPRFLVQDIIKSGQKTSLGGERRDLTIFFSDITDFTSLSENAPPEAIMRRLSHYFETLVDVINRSGGTIDKYIGDSIMAFWNAPHRNNTHIQDACLAILRCRAVSLDREEIISSGENGDGLPMFRTRFSLHTGETVVGNIGSIDRMAYTAVGSSVNIASRLEGLNKVYGTEILVSEAVKSHVSDRFIFRIVDHVTLRGVNHPIKIYELLGINPDSDFAQNLDANDSDHAFIVTPLELDGYKRWCDFMRHYDNKDWGVAKRWLDIYEEDFGQSLLTEHYQNRLNVV